MKISQCRFIIICSALLLAACAGRTEQTEMEQIKRTVRERFPDVTQVSTAQLSQWLSAPETERPILLDARSPEEFEVSHLPNARPAADESQALEQLRDADQNRRIVVYCSVGWRSSALAQKLKARGYANVSNLEGSIFQWANEGRPVYRNGQQVSQVHPFDEKWGRLLKAELRSPLPGK
jgi:rhodanese-related sulfurtransferase